MVVRTHIYIYTHVYAFIYLPILILPLCKLRNCRGGYNSTGFTSWRAAGESHQLCESEKCPLMEARFLLFMVPGKYLSISILIPVILKVDECRRGILILQLTPPKTYPSTSRLWRMVRNRSIYIQVNLSISLILGGWVVIATRDKRGCSCDGKLDYSPVNIIPSKIVLLMKFWRPPNLLDRFGASQRPMNVLGPQQFWVNIPPRSA